MTAETIKETKKRMEKVGEDLRAELATLRTGRASITLLDHIHVDYYGTPTPIKQLATLSVPDPFNIVIQSWDPSVLPAVEKAIRSSDLGLNPANDGKVVRVPIPPLTEERRRDMAKHLHKVLEAHRTSVRNIRRDINEAIKKQLKEKKISEDDEKQALAEVQKLTDHWIGQVDEIGRSKEKEIMSI